MDSNVYIKRFLKGHGTISMEIIVCYRLIKHLDLNDYTKYYVDEDSLDKY